MLNFRAGVAGSVRKMSSSLFFQVCASMAFMVLVAGCSRDESHPTVAPLSGVNTEQREPEVLPFPDGDSGIVATTTLLATISADERPHQTELFHVVFNDLGTGVAYIARVGKYARVVHNGKPGKLYKEINVYKLAMSPDGQRIAYGALVDDRWIMVIDGKEEGPSVLNVGPPVFSLDSRHIAYEAQIGEKWYIVVDGKKNSGWAAYYAKPAFSGDSKKILYIENPAGDRKMRVVVSDLRFAGLSYKEPSGHSLVINSDRTRVAAVLDVDGKQRTIEFSFDRPDVVKRGPLYDAISSLAISADGTSLSYAAERNGQRSLVLDDRKERLPEGQLNGPPVIRADKKAVGAIIASDDRFYYYEAFIPPATEEKKYDEAADLVYSRDSRLHAYAARRGKKWFVVVNGKESPSYDRVVSPAFTPDGKKLVYRVRKNGKRFVVVTDASGKVLRQHSAYEQVFQPVFTADGQSVAYGVKDGNELWWKVEKL